MHKAHARWIVQSWLFCASTVFAAGSGILVTIQDSIVTDFEAPGLVSSGFLVTNSDNVAHELIETVIAPEGWQVIGGESIFKINPGTSEVRIVAVAVKAQTPPGEYRITYQVHDFDDTLSTSQCHLTVHIKPTIAVELSVVEAPLFVEAGSAYDVVFSVKHVGNEAAAVDLTLKSSAGFQVSLDSTQITLAPEQVRRITAHIVSSRTLQHPVKDRLFIRATAGPDSLKAGTQTYSVVSIVPVAQRAVASYRQLPSRLTTRYVGGDGADGMQLELSGSGPIDDKNHFVEYRFRGPGEFENSAFGLRDEIYLKLKSDDGAIIAGDQSYAVSNLLERGRLGRGAEVDLNQSHVEARVLGFQARNQIPDYEAYGAFLGYKFGPHVSTRGNVLNKKTELDDFTLYSFSTTFEPAPQWKVNLETATGTKDEGVDESPLAFWSRIDGRLDATQVSLQKYIANRYFRGQIQDVDQNLVDLFTPLPFNFGWVNAYRDFSENLTKNEFLPTAPREKHFRTGLTYRNSSLANASLDFELHTREDKLYDPEYDNQSAFFAARLQKSSKRVGLSSTVTRGIRKDYLRNSSSILESYRLSLDARPVKGHKCEGWWQTGHSGYSIDTRRSTIVGFSSDYSALQKLHLNASFQIVDRDNDKDFESVQYDAGLQYDVFNNHLITLRMRRREYNELRYDTETSYLLSYQLPLGIPLGRMRNQGALQGRIYDVDNPASSGIPGALLRVGEKTAISDKNGKFEFRSLKPGIHYLQIENAAFGLDRIPLQQMPVELSILGARTESIDLKIAKSASISGNVSIYGYSNENTDRGLLIEESDHDSLAQRQRELILVRGLPECSVILTSGNETINVSTQADGSFFAKKLRPGVWAVHVQPANLPIYHQIETETFTITLNPGEEQTCEFRALPRSRRLLIASSGAMRVGESLALTSPMIEEAPVVLDEPNTVAKNIPVDTLVHKVLDDIPGKWYVQVAAYKSQRRADESAAKFRERGYSTVVVPPKSNSSTIYQLRVGGYDSPANASVAASELRSTYSCDTLVISTNSPAIDYIANLAKHLADTANVSELALLKAIPTTEVGEWYVQLGAYRNPNNVERLVRLLNNVGIRSKLIPIAVPAEPITQVRVGGYSSKSEGKSAAEMFNSWMETNTLLIQAKPN